MCSIYLLWLNIVLILSLQSPWSSVTQGPLTLRVLTKSGTRSFTLCFYPWVLSVLSQIMAFISSPGTTFAFLCLCLLMTSLWPARRVPSLTLSLRSFHPTSSFAILGLQCSYWALRFTEIIPIAPLPSPRANSSPIFSRSMVYRIASLYPHLSTLDVASLPPCVPSPKQKP